MPSKEVISKQTFFVYTALFFILIWSLLLRVDSYSLWQVTPEKFLLQNGEPMLSTLDGYYYLNTAKEILSGQYSSTDTMRAYPGNVARPSTPSLLPYLLAFLQKASGISLNWLGALLPVFLGLLIAIPLYAFSICWGGYTMAIGAVAIGTLSYYYAQRTSLARLDTDCLNLTLALGCAFLFYQFSKGISYKRYAYLTFGLLLYIVFFWWWDMSSGAVTILALSPLFIGLIFHYRPPLKEGILFYSFFLCTILICLLLYHKQFLDIFNSIIGQLYYISKVETGSFPNIGVSIAEQKNISWHHMDNLTVRSWPILILSGAGICLFTIKRRLDLFYILPLTLVGTFAIFFANRFAIFLTPIVAIGFGYFFHSLIHHTKYQKTGIVFLTAAILFIGWKSHKLGAGHPSPFSSPIYHGMERIKYLTEENSVIWSWWDEGHPLIYFGERPTISDGYLHGGELSYINALPFATSNERLAANFIRFYVVHGKEGLNRFFKATGSSKADSYEILKNILASSPLEVLGVISSANLTVRTEDNLHSATDWLKFFFPDNKTSPHIYLFIDSHLASRLRWIYWLGTWNINTHQGTKTLRSIKIENINFDDKNNPINNSFTLDAEKGLFFIPGVFEQSLQVRNISTTTRTSSTSRTYTVPNGHEVPEPPLSAKIKKSNTLDEKHTNIGEYFLELFPEKNMLILQDRKKINNMINNLYLREKKSSFFTPVEITAKYQIWKVEGDKL